MKSHGADVTFPEPESEDMETFPNTERRKKGRTMKPRVKPSEEHLVLALAIGMGALLVAVALI